MYKIFFRLAYFCALKNGYSILGMFLLLFPKFSLLYKSQVISFTFSCELQIGEPYGELLMFLSNIS